MNVTLEDAYDEACKALGAAVVTQRLQAQEMQRLAAENESLRAALAEQGTDSPHAGTVADPDPCPPFGETRVQHV